MSGEKPTTFLVELVITKRFRVTVGGALGSVRLEDESDVEAAEKIALDHIPKWLGGEVTGIAHERCNLKHNNEHDTPLYAKGNRQRQRYIGAKVRKGRPMVGTRDSGIKLRIGGGRPIDRRTGREF